MTPPSAAPAADAAVTPSLLRRIACLVYEGLLLFGLGLIPGALGALLLALTGRAHPVVLQAFAFLMYAAYFTWFWSTRGQTLAMQTWHIKVVTDEGDQLTRARAFSRFLASCLWFAPAAALSLLNRWTPWQSLAAAAVGVSLQAYACSGRVCRVTDATLFRNAPAGP